MASSLARWSNVNPKQVVGATSFILALLACTNHSYSEIIFYSGFPVYHGGNFVNVALSYSLLLLLGDFIARCLSKHLRLLAYSAMVLMVFVGSYSSRLFIAQFTLPVVAASIFAFLFKDGARRRFFYPLSHLPLILTIAISSVLGFLAYLGSIHQCTDVSIVASAQVFASHLSRLSSSGFLSISLIVFVVGSLLVVSRHLMLIDSANGSSPPKIYLAHLCVLLTLASTLVVFYLAAIDEWTGYGRYLVSLAYLLPCAASLCIVDIVSLFSRAHPNPHPLLSLITLPALVFFIPYAFDSYSVVKTTARSTLVDKHPSPYRWIESTLDKHNLLGLLGYVADPPLESRALGVLTGWRINSLSVSTDGNPLIFPHSRQEYLNKELGPAAVSSALVRDVFWVATSSLDFDRMQLKYGRPIKVLDCTNEGICLYIFDKSRISTTVASFPSTWKGDVYRCVTIDSSLGRLLKTLKASLRF